MLSDQQFEGLAGELNKGGGFSIRTHGAEAGTSPSNAYMVGIQGRGANIPSPTTGSALRGFAETQGSALSAPNRYLGGWSGEKETALDVSQAFPRTKRGAVQSRQATVANAQKAAGEVGHSGEYIGDVTVPAAKLRGGERVHYAPRSVKSWVYDPIKSRRPRQAS